MRRPVGRDCRRRCPRLRRLRRLAASTALALPAGEVLEHPLDPGALGHQRLVATQVGPPRALGSRAGGSPVADEVDDRGLGGARPALESAHPGQVVRRGPALVRHDLLGDLVRRLRRGDVRVGGVQPVEVAALGLAHGRDDLDPVDQVLGRVAAQQRGVLTDRRPLVARVGERSDPSAVDRHALLGMGDRRPRVGDSASGLRELGRQRDVLRPRRGELAAYGAEAGPGGPELRLRRGHCPGRGGDLRRGLVEVGLRAVELAFDPTLVLGRAGLRLRQPRAERERRRKDHGDTCRRAAAEPTDVRQRAQCPDTGRM